MLCFERRAIYFGRATARFGHGHLHFGRATARFGRGHLHFGRATARFGRGHLHFGRTILKKRFADYLLQIAFSYASTVSLEYRFLKTNAK